jgi:ribosome maturation factor RimP
MFFLCLFFIFAKRRSELTLLKDRRVDPLSTRKVFQRYGEEKLDAADRMTDPYILEVSSPGLTRPLKKDKDFKRNLGKKVEVKLYRAVDGSKEFEAILTGYTDTTITLQLDPAEEPKEFSRNDISMIRLAFE